MQLVSLPASPFAARVRIASYAKGLDIEMTPPPENWPKSASFLRLNPVGRVPVLITDDGEAIQESSVILEYLEERFPGSRSLMPATAEGRAAVRLLVRVCDLYLMPPMVALARESDADRARERVAELVSSLDILERLLPNGQRYAAGDALTFADCALAPVLFAVSVTGERLQLKFLEGRASLQHYERRVKEDKWVGKVIREMDDGLRALPQSSN